MVCNWLETFEINSEKTTFYPKFLKISGWKILKHSVHRAKNTPGFEMGMPIALNTSESKG